MISSRNTTAITATTAILLNAIVLFNEFSYSTSSRTEGNILLDLESFLIVVIKYYQKLQEYEKVWNQYTLRFSSKNIADRLNELDNRRRGLTSNDDRTIFETV